jgi:hypothetical protein
MIEHSQSYIERSMFVFIIIAIVSSSIIYPVVTVSAAPARIDTSNYHAAPQISQSTSTSGTPSTQAALQIPRTLQSTDLVNSLAFYEVTFITSTTGVIDKIQMDFPAGTNIGAAGVIERVGIGGGTLLKSGSSLTYDVTAPVSVPANTFIRLEITGIKNPTNPSSSLTAGITTMDSIGNVIDGPSQTNVYVIRQISASDIADSAVTTQKIADEAITPTKPAESFMKRIMLLDDAGGNALGWNPDGIETAFNIIAPVDEDSFVDIMLPRTCSVAFGLDPGFFTFHCDTAPPDNSVLNYLITNLPVHINE